MDKAEKEEKAKDLVEKCDIIQKTILWWEEECDKALNELEVAEAAGDETKIEEFVKRIEMLLHRSALEKIELDKLEQKINKFLSENKDEK